MIQDAVDIQTIDHSNLISTVKQAACGTKIRVSFTITVALMYKLQF